MNKEILNEQIRKDKESVLGQIKEIHAAMIQVRQDWETKVIDPLGDLACEANGLLYDEPAAENGKADIGETLEAFYASLGAIKLTTAVSFLASLYFQISGKQIND